MGNNPDSLESALTGTHLSTPPSRSSGRVPYGVSLALLTDLYQLTMAYGYWRHGLAEREAVFHLNFRKNPFKGGYAIAAGLEPAMAYLEQLHFDREDLDYLASLQGNDGAPLFPDPFLRALEALRFSCDVDGIPEGTVVFPHEPLLRITGPLLQAQLIETALLNQINFQTLIATKAARVCWAAEGEPVLEFGLRRAQGIDGSLAASRAAFIGGCTSTSNVLAGRLFGIPVRGTHAHAWVMAFEDELLAFEKYAEVLPNNCIFLVDTYDTLEGVRRACRVGVWLRERGFRLMGIRLDSGDLAYLSIEARKILDQAGFQDAVIVASNDLDEQVVAELKRQGARIGVWGVGTQLVTGGDQPALGGVYKLTALRGESGAWEYRIKLSEQAIKVSNPGILQVRRYCVNREDSVHREDSVNREAVADVILDSSYHEQNELVMVDPMDATRRKHLPAGTPFEDLLVPLFRRGQRVYQPPPLADIRARTQAQLALFHPGIKRFANPHAYPVGLEGSLHALKTRMILKARGEEV